MSKHSPNAKCEFSEEKRKLLFWIARCIDEETNFDNINLDLPEMSVLLQSMGFRLDTFEKVLDGDTAPILRKSPTAVADKNMMRVELTCPKSGMRSTLIKQTPSCKCPSEQEVDKGQFWCITGCGPSSQNSVNISNSSLLPTVTAAKTKIIKVLLSKVLMVINGIDVNENWDNSQPTKNVSLLTRHRSLDALQSSGNTNFVSNALKRRPSWEVDPKTSPPTQTSSPVPSLCATMSKISLSEQQSNCMMKNLESIKKLVDETLEMASSNNATFVKNALPKKRVSDIKPLEGPSASDLLQRSTPPSFRRTTPRRMLTPKKTLPTPGVKKDPMAPPSKIAMFRKKTVASGVSPTPTRSLRKDTPRPRTNLLKQNVGTSGSCESIFKSKGATNIGIRSSLASPRFGRGTEAAGTSGIAKLKSVGKLTLNAITPAKKKT